MKNLIVLVSAAVAMGCVLLLFKLKREADAATARAAAAESRSAAIAAEAEQFESRSKNLRSQLREARGEALEQSAETRELKQRLAGAGEEQKKSAAVFSDPEMKPVIAAEAKSGVARNVKALLDAGLAKYLQLNDEQSAKLEQLLTEKASVFWEQMLLPMMTGELDEAGMAAAGKSARQALETNKAQLLALLGEDGYAVYEWFDQTQEQRDTLKSFSPSFAKAGQPLNAEQQNQLLAVMIEERLHFQFQNDISDPAKLDFERWHDNFTDEKLNAFFQEKKQLDDRVVQRAQAVLTAEQAALLKEMLTQQLLRSKFTARSTTAMFGKRK